VLQEAWLAKSVVFWYENITIEWESLARANHWVTKYGYFLPTLQQTNLPRLWGNLGDLQRQHQERSKSNPLNLKKPLLELVWQGLDLKASDPRDKIFGLFGLAEETHPDQLSKLENRLIYPDYTKNVSNVWSDFTWWWINRYQSLKILGVVHANHGRTWQSVHCTANEGVTSHDQPPHDHPSWALWHTGKAKWVSKGLDFSSRYSASGATKTILGSRSPNALSDVSGFSLLRLKGLRLGTIRSTEPFSWKDKSHELCMTFERLFDFSGDRRLYNSPVTIPDEFDLKRWELGHFAVHHRISEITSLQQLPQLPCLDDCSISLDGGLRGLCPSGTKGGDVVVILYGGSVPYVLREKEGGDGWQFVGECYVEGMMRGEALERAEGDRIQEEWFVLV
jgi:hypothetical protein